MKFQQRINDKKAGLGKRKVRNTKPGVQRERGKKRKQREKGKIITSHFFWYRYRHKIHLCITLKSTIMHSTSVILNNYDHQIPKIKFLFLSVPSKKSNSGFQIEIKVDQIFSLIKSGQVSHFSQFNPFFHCNNL